MRYASQLRTTRRHHILKSRWHSFLITIAWFVGLFALMLLFVNFSNLDAHQLFVGFVISLLRTTIAYIISAVLSILIALVITSHPVVENIFLPILDVLQSFPSFALFPILVQTIKGQNELIIITVLVISMIWPILFAIIAGIKNRREDLEEAATVFGAVGWKRIIYFSIPELMPAIITGSIIGWGNGWEFIIGAELLVTVQSGIGHYLGVLGTNGQTNLLMLGIIILMLLLFLLNKAIWLPLLHRTTLYETEA